MNEAEFQESFSKNLEPLKKLKRGQKFKLIFSSPSSKIEKPTKGQKVLQGFLLLFFHFEGNLKFFVDQLVEPEIVKFIEIDNERSPTSSF